nr:immunoglobulin light chain junction region [Macaca mulatta]MOX52820.1 immunoglobulin light chain junction region [Macaca mulatta]MOX53436.1 immunoglobulin light chain junction region [Macaca mulatta]MOX53817.1 immunoglobulin light chain junction region [Macaca mulatta]MOX54669.1 immunoglobulin light chain junction region [Macaca mulatta]
CLQYSSNPFTF